MYNECEGTERNCVAIQYFGPWDLGSQIWHTYGMDFWLFFFWPPTA